MLPYSWLMTPPGDSSALEPLEILAIPRAIFERLTRDDDQTVHALTEGAGVSQPMVSKHLSVLKRARLVRNRRKGRETHYHARPETLAPLVDWIGHYGVFWQNKFYRLEDLLKRMEQ